MIDVRAAADEVGYPLTVLAALVESTGIPFPGEVVVVALAAYAAAGHMDLRLVVLCSVVGAILGADLGYLAGDRGGRPFVERTGRALRLRAPNLARAEMFFARHAEAAVLFGRFAAGARTWVAVLAGMSHMPFWRFQLFSLGGACAWAVLLACVGALLGDNWSPVEHALGSLGYGWLAFFLAAAVIYLLARTRVGQM